MSLNDNSVKILDNYTTNKKPYRLNDQSFESSIIRPMRYSPWTSDNS